MWSNVLSNRGAMTPDEIRRLVEAGILKAVSVGFKPIHSQPRRNGDKIVGEYFQRQELVETSLVSVPANPNALAVAKSLNLSAATMDLVFGAEHGRIRSKDMRSDVPGEHAVITRIERSGAMSTLPQRISEMETQIRGYQDKLTDHLSTVDDSNVSDAQLEATKDLQERITQLQKQRDVLVDSEKLLSSTALTRLRSALTLRAARPTTESRARELPQASPSPVVWFA